MRRSLMILVTVVMSLALAPLLGAQIGKRVSIGAGTPEDKALAEINAATDPAQKLALIDKFLAERSEEHTSELQSRGHLVCRLLLEKKKINQINHHFRKRNSH